MKKPSYAKLEYRIKELERVALENKKSSTDFSTRQNHETLNDIDFLECLDAVGQAMNTSKDVDHIIEDAIGAVFSFFGCDRVWVFHPCDPDSSTFRVLSEKNHPQYYGTIKKYDQIGEMLTVVEFLLTDILKFQQQVRNSN